MKKQFKSKDFSGAAFVVFGTEEKAREFVENSKSNPIKYDDGSVLECSLQDDHHKKKALELATGGKSSDDKQTRKDKRKEELEKKTNEHLEKLNTENLSGAVIHLAGRKMFDVPRMIALLLFFLSRNGCQCHTRTDQRKIQSFHQNALD